MSNAQSPGIGFANLNAQELFNTATAAPSRMENSITNSGHTQAVVTIERIHSPRIYPGTLAGSS